MCGIVAYIGPYDTKVEDIFYDLFVVNQIRGDDSSGLAVCHPDKVKVAKSVGDPAFLMCHAKEMKRLKHDKHNAIAVIGHGRAATKGDISYDNAHPFQFNHITMVHNGTVHGASSILREADRKDNKFDTDSETIAWAIASYGIEETWSRLNGAACLVWWDQQDVSLNVIRNDQRPLAFAKIEGSEHVFFASESWMLKGCVSRNHKTVGECWQPKPNWHLTWKLNAGNVVKEGRELAPYKAPPAQTFLPTRNNVVHIIKPLVTIQQQEEAFEVWDIRHPKDNPELSSQVWAAQCKEGMWCHCCGNSLCVIDYHSGAEIQDQTYACRICVKFYTKIGWDEFFAEFYNDPVLANIKADGYKENVA